ncbi:hypothetical protein NQ318_003374 [Aromia moschata]|uniref:Gustatory receptor n=1 Tax=Aromia moschata TaxID=1265417 RepID=A0AAV8YCC4_9CUCU|nr:hypothetical protein NQ318_003374 [Aromia moschata]
MNKKKTQCSGSMQMESLYIIMCCERATVAGNRMKQLCHKLQEDFGDNSSPRKELFKLAQLVENFKPKFTAANFFVINQSTILDIINIATTYLIVVIQFCSAGESVCIIICCEQAVSAGNKTKGLCYKLQENFDPKSRTKKELFKLAEIVQTFKPEFTAANFFVINKGTILQIISIATTYLIVIIEFYSTLQRSAVEV